MELILSEIRKCRNIVTDMKFEMSNKQLYMYFLKTDQYVFFLKMTFASNHRKWLLTITKNNKERIQKGGIKC